MIHYINNKPHKNIKLQPTKRRAVAHYRHTQRVAAIKDIAGVLTTMALFAILLAAAVVALVGIN